jgi:hypothetical protein
LKTENPLGIVVRSKKKLKTAMLLCRGLGALTTRFHASAIRPLHNIDAGSQSSQAQFRHKVAARNSFHSSTPAAFHRIRPDQNSAKGLLNEHARIASCTSSFLASMRLLQRTPGLKSRVEQVGMLGVPSSADSDGYLHRNQVCGFALVVCLPPGLRTPNCTLHVLFRDKIGFPVSRPPRAIHASYSFAQPRDESTTISLRGLDF